MHRGRVMSDRFFPNQSLHDMPLPHPQTRSKQQRHEDVLKQLAVRLGLRWRPSTKPMSGKPNRMWIQRRIKRLVAGVMGWWWSKWLWKC